MNKQSWKTVRYGRERSRSDDERNERAIRKVIVSLTNVNGASILSARNVRVTFPARTFKAIQACIAQRPDRSQYPGRRGSQPARGKARHVK